MPRNAGAQLDSAVNRTGPVLIEAAVDQFTPPPMPAKIKPEQAKKFSEALIRGEPNRLRIALTAAADTVRQVV